MQVHLGKTKTCFFRKGIFECILTASNEFLPHSEEYRITLFCPHKLPIWYLLVLYLRQSQTGAPLPLICAQVCHLTVIRGNSSFGSYCMHFAMCYSEAKYNIIKMTLFSSCDCVQPQTPTCQHCVNSNVRFFYSSKQRAVFVNVTFCWFYHLHSRPDTVSCSRGPALSDSVPGPLGASAPRSFSNAALSPF